MIQTYNSKSCCKSLKEWGDREKSKLYLRSMLPEERDNIIKDKEANLNKDSEGFLEMAGTKSLFWN
ncbi:hypothetical protein OOZ15_18735 [Galbibacter sp. EGI 63066]|uniref:hypothetical protein n=1 Tax=Galbibacter sp. EGI 63066 TaxID=2993559 RepID=UPI0022494924|nr:hypothetical protein [Galbibacter sp. EGI 63066]MCX2681995.1 hypothetical protein [Galbibacter sp. EGI 63066]